MLSIPEKQGKAGRKERQIGVVTETCTSAEFVPSARDAAPEPPSDAIRAAWAAEQERLRSLIVERDDPGAAWPPTLVGGTDISFAEGSQVDACATIVVVRMPENAVVYESYQMVRLSAPYISGFLAFREAPFLAELLAHLRARAPALVPQVVLVDGNGVLHPRGCGLASHLGVVAGIPTVGVAKKLLEVDGVGRERAEALFARECTAPHSHALLVGRSGRTLGAVYRSPTSTHPLYVSSGHRVSLESALGIVAACCVHRVPEPTRQADLRSREFLRQNYAPMIQRQPAAAAAAAATPSKKKAALLSGAEAKEAAQRMLVAADSGDIATVSALLDAGADPNMRTMHPHFNKLSAPLHCAARSCHVNVVFLLLSRDADINIADIEKWTPLMYAANSGNTNVVEVLIAGRADVSVTDTIHHRTALDMAKHRQFHDIVKLLGGDPDDLSYHRTPEEIAAAGAQTPVMQGIHFGQTDLFLGRYRIEEEDVAEIECFRQYPDISPTLDLAALDAVLGDRRVTLCFFHDRMEHASAATAGGFLRSCALATNEFLLVVPGKPTTKLP